MNKDLLIKETCTKGFTLHYYEKPLVTDSYDDGFFTITIDRESIVNNDYLKIIK